MQNYQACLDLHIYYAADFGGSRLQWVALYNI